MQDVIFDNAIVTLFIQLRDDKGFIIIHVIRKHVGLCLRNYNAIFHDSSRVPIVDPEYL